MDAIGEFIEDYSANLERREIDNKTSLHLTIVDADYRRKRKIAVARSRYKKVKAEVEERIGLLRRMTDGQA